MGMGLIALYDAEQEGALSWRDAALDELRQLADAYPGKLTLREWLVWGLADAIGYAERDGLHKRRDALLEELLQLARAYPQDAAVRKQLAMGLYNRGAPDNTLVAVRDPRPLYYLRRVLEKTDTGRTEVVVMTARLYHRAPSFGGSELMDTARGFTEYERELFTSVLDVAKKEAKEVSLLVVPMMCLRRSWPRRSA